MDTIIGKDIAVAAALLKAGKLVAIPTETVYGLAANALNPEAVLKVFEAKQRPAFDPLIVHIASPGDLEYYTNYVPREALALATAFWPGPLTLLLPKKAVIPDLVTSGLPTVAIRIPSHPMTAELLKIVGFPLAAPSANLFGRISPTNAIHVKDQLKGRIAYILDGGDCGIGLESTIVGFPDDAPPTIYRLGGIPVEDIEQIVGKVSVLPHSTSNPQAPGMLKIHYAPGKPVCFFDENTAYPENVSFLRFKDYFSGIPAKNQLILSENGDLKTAARNLFAYLRKLDSNDTTAIIVEKLPEIGLGKAINDRLKRASAVEQDY